MSATAAMSASTLPVLHGRSPCCAAASAIALRRAASRADGSCTGCCKRNCSVTPAPAARVLRSLCVLSLGDRRRSSGCRARSGHAVRLARAARGRRRRCSPMRGMPATASASRCAGPPAWSSSSDGRRVEQRRVRAGLGARRARARRPLADRAVGPGRADCGGPLCAARTAAAAGRTNCVRRCARQRRAARRSERIETVDRR